jgi:hypothetical protein
MAAGEEDPERIARNEGLFRLLNDGRELEAQGLGVDGLVAFTCECGRLTCHEPIRLTIGEYEQVRRQSRQFAIVVGHQFEQTEDVIAEHERYAVVRKREEAEPIVTAMDPRRGGGPNAPGR